jgi:hypothetical protein
MKNSNILNLEKEDAYTVRRLTIMAGFTNCWQSNYSKNLRTIIHLVLTQSILFIKNKKFLTELVAYFP